LGQLSQLSTATHDRAETFRPYLLHSEGEIRVMGLQSGAEIQIYDLKGALLSRLHPLVDGAWPIPAEYLRQGALIMRIQQSKQIYNLKIGRTG
jgi:hypothetical protein